MFGLRRARSRRRIRKWLEIIKDKNPHYYKLFKSFDLTDQPYSDIIRLFNTLKNNSNLIFLMSKNPIHYKTFDELQKELNSTINYYKSIISNISYYGGNTKINIKLKFIKNLSKIDKKKFISIDKDIIKNLHQYDYEDFISFTEDNKFPFIDRRKDIIDKLILTLEKHNSVLYNKDNIVIARVYDHKIIKKVGPSTWCIKNRKEWNAYSRKGKQFIIFDFNLFPNDRQYCIGYTMNKRNRIIHIYDSKNNEGSKSDIKYYLKLLKKKKKKERNSTNNEFNYCYHCGKSIHKSIEKITKNIRSY